MDFISAKPRTLQIYLQKVRISDMWFDVYVQDDGDDARRSDRQLVCSTCPITVCLGPTKPALAHICCFVSISDNVGTLPFADCGRWCVNDLKADLTSCRQWLVCGV